MKRIYLMTACLVLLGAASSFATTWSVPNDFTTIEAALAGATHGDIIQVDNGTYTPPSTLNVDKAVTMTGASEAGVILDLSAVGGYGLSITSGDVILENFTMIAPSPNYPIHASGTANPSGLNNLTLQRITVSGVFQRSAFDVHGFNNVILSHLTASNALAGNGVQVTGCVGVSMNNITTMNNAWGSIAIYASGPAILNRASSNITIDGDSCQLGEDNIYNQDEFGLTNTDIIVYGYGFLVSSPSVLPGFGLYKDTEAQAIATALAFGGAPGTIIRSLTGGPMLVPSGLTIQDAIDAANPGDVISVLTGHFEEQLHIDKDNLTIIGAGAGATFVDSPEVLLLGYTTTISNYPVVFVDHAVGVGLKDLTVDGLGNGNSNVIFHGIAYLNSGGTLDAVRVTGIQDTPFSGTEHGNGVIVDIFDGGPYTMLMTDVDVDGFQQTGIVLAGDGLHATLTNTDILGAGPTPVLAQNGLEVAWGATGVATDCMISNLSYDGSFYTASGMLGYYGNTFRLESCDFDAIQTSVYCLDMSLELDQCELTNPTYDGVYMISTGAKNGDGDILPRREARPFSVREGGKVKSPVSLLIENSTITGAGLTDTWGVTCWGDGPVDLAMNGCEITNWDRGLAFYNLGSGVINSVVRDTEIRDNLSFGAWTNTTNDQDCRSNWWGHSSGPLHIVTNPLATGDEISDHILYDQWLGTAGIAVLPQISGPVNCSTPLTLQFHYTPDPVYAPPLRGYEITFTTNSILSFGAGDIEDSGALGAIGLHYFDIIDNLDGTYTVNDGLLGTTPGLTVEDDLFSVEVTATGSGTGEVTILSVKLRDLDNAEINSEVAGAVVQTDCTPPPAVENIVAQTGHETVDVSWTMSDESDTDHYEIYRGVWYDGATPYASAYPEYDDLTASTIPTRPATFGAMDPGEWVLAGTTSVGVLNFTDSFEPRGVYYYEVFAVDALDNASLPALANDRAANYWLGDINLSGAYDGLVDGTDISVFGATYGSDENDGHYNNEADVGPTDDSSGYGFPTTDSVIDFEDLMIVAQNYGVVSKFVPDSDDATVMLSWLRIDELTWSLSLLEPCIGLKGVRISAAMPEGATCEVTQGSLLLSQDSPVFLDNIQDHGLDTGLAVLGRGDSIVGMGELLRVTASQGLELGAPIITARGHDNRDLQVNTSIDTPDLPTAFALGMNYPNPFNPSTTIAFDLPQAAGVRLGVYSLDGRLVRTLVHETITAGRHSVEWNGRDGDGRLAATGTYVMRLEANGLRLVRKVLLMK